MAGCTSQYWESVDEKGRTLSVGAGVDLTVLGPDPLTTAPDEFALSPVIFTMVDGEIAGGRQTPAIGAGSST